MVFSPLLVTKSVYVLLLYSVWFRQSENFRCLALTQEQEKNTNLKRKAYYLHLNVVLPFFISFIYF